MEEVTPEEVLVEETPEVVAEPTPEAETVTEETPEVVEVAVEEPTPTPSKKSRKESVETEVVAVEEPTVEPQVVQIANPNRVVRVGGQHISIK